MSKDLTDADDFTSPIPVPEGLDSRDDAAGDVELIAQRLANRTRYVRNHAAFRGEPNTFTEQCTFQKTIVGGSPAADQPILHTTSDPPSLSTAWRVLFAAKYAGGLYAGTYTGSNLDDTGGAYLICTNAEWLPASSQWRQMNPAHDSVAVIWHRGMVRIARIPAGTAPWATWPTTFAVGKGVGGGSGNEAVIGGDFYCAATAYAGTVRATNAMKVGTGEYDYAVVRPRTFPLDLATACGDVIRLASGVIKTHGVTIIPDDPGGPAPQAVSDDGMGTVVVPLRLTEGTAIQSVQVMVRTVTGSGALMCRLDQRAPPAWTGGGSPNVPAFTSLVSASTPTAPGTYVLTLSFPAVTFDHLYEYQIVFLGNMPGDQLMAVRVNGWNDVGPRNMVQGAGV